jgi:hypothetical protein
VERAYSEWQGAQVRDSLTGFADPAQQAAAGRAPPPAGLSPLRKQVRYRAPIWLRQICLRTHTEASAVWRVTRIPHA